MTSPTSAERAALKVADAAAEGPASAYGLPNAIVFALGSAGLLMDPETAAELEKLRAHSKHMEPFEVLTPQSCDKGEHVDWFVDSENHHLCPWCRVAELESQVCAAGAEAEQRHQTRDTSETPLGCFMTGDICAIAIADALADPLAVDVPPVVTA